MTVLAEGDVVRIAGERNRRYKVERIKSNGEIDVRGERGLRTVTTDRIIPAPHDAPPTIGSAPAPKRRGRR